MPNDPKTPPEAPEVESPIDPEAITTARKIVADVAALIETGAVDQIAMYIGRRDGTYQVWQNRNNGRHEDAGRLLEFAISRLGFVQRETVVDMIDEK